ncbi:AAA family ATPase [Sinorhizobium meliloti]|uniref:AAA family ATPase n=1 Tax=Rhizobium meliloti TaxID=382 RepID=UPI000FD6F06B|nr:ATP-binding protein [Sinorhizobium meliloti]RVH05166.1 ATP-binding protein [Sinorhizobium meliloti]RVK74506.1 ATP-binding protein [Sinorhizobium meliloti]RVM18992.1 ATP-binding protein [Sinorhizobium meliloti]RVQ76947.1 ATP-binding protein [Sinorhizobium meliloti]
MVSSNLQRLGLANRWPTSEKVAILVGPNGSGKSRFLRELAVQVRGDRDIAIISNTAHDRFRGLRGLKRISAGGSSRSPKNIVKRAVGKTIDQPDSRYYQIGAILDYCGYQPRFGFIVDTDQLSAYLDPEDFLFDPNDYDAVVAFLARHNPKEVLWVDQGESAFSFSLGREFGAILRNEESLRRQGRIRGIQVFLQRHDGEIIELLNASSGELSLISSLVFLISSIGQEPVILIDEPENSLHPRWQREYIEKILAAAFYRNATIIVATHAPLIVTGALSTLPEILSVFQIRDGEPSALDLNEARASAANVEGVLWRAFDVITPASHFVSEQMVGVVTQVERGEITRDSAIALVNDMASNSFDEQQRKFFDAVRNLIGQVDLQRREADKSDG